MGPPTWSQEQLLNYYIRINFPAAYHRTSINGLSSEEQLQYLTILQKYHLTEIPFENLSLHYSPHRSICLHPQYLYDKQVETPGRGGYCMENNLIFNIALRTLGYDLYSAGARVKEGPVWGGFAHMCNLVSIGGEKYMLDVGFGPNGPTHPMRLNREGEVTSHAKPASVRLMWANIDANVDPAQRLWVYQHRINAEAEWIDMYCFTELEFLTADYSVMNHYTSTSKDTWFTRKVICAKHMFGKEEDGEAEEIVGAVILQDDLKWRVKGESMGKKDFEDDKQRVKALKDVFGVDLTPSDQAAIAGTGVDIQAALNHF